MRIEVRKSAIRDLNKMDRKKREKIHEKILELAQFPEVTGVKKLTNFEPAYRLRVGDYRVLFDVSEEVVQGICSYPLKLKAYLATESR